MSNQYTQERLSRSIQFRLSVPVTRRHHDTHRLLVVVRPFLLELFGEGKDSGHKSVCVGSDLASCVRLVGHRCNLSKELPVVDGFIFVRIFFVNVGSALHVAEFGFMAEVMGGTVHRLGDLEVHGRVLR